MSTSHTCVTAVVQSVRHDKTRLTAFLSESEVGGGVVPVSQFHTKRKGGWFLSLAGADAFDCSAEQPSQKHQPSLGDTAHRATIPPPSEKQPHSHRPPESPTLLHGEGPWVELKGWLRACCHCQGPWSGHPRAHRLAVSPCFPCPLLDIWPLALLYRPLDFCSHTSESD